MDLTIIKERLCEIEVEEANLNEQIKTISIDLEDADVALQSARKIQSEFESFVFRRKASKEKSMFENGLKCFRSFLNKQNRMLTGNDYLEAQNKVDEMNSIARQAVERLDDDLSYCKQELCSLIAEKEKLMAEYKMMMAAE